jgi:tRNA 2-thiouridine synthesizing protein A
MLGMTTAIKAVRALDCLGLYCPEPLQTQGNIDQIKPSEILEVITDDPAAEEDLKRFAKRAGQISLTHKTVLSIIQL